MPSEQLELDQHYDSKHPFRTLQMFLNVTWQRTIGILLLNIVKAAPLWVSPLYLEFVLGAARVPEEYPSGAILWVSIGYAIIMLQNVITHTWYAVSTSRFIRGMEQRLRAALVKRLQQLSFAFYSNSESGRLQAKILRDVEDVSMLGRIYYDTLLAILVGLVSTVVICLAKDPWMLLAFVVLVPVAVGLRKLFRVKMRKYNREFRMQMENMASETAEMVDLVPVTRAHGVENHELDKMERRLDDVFDRGVRIDRINAVFHASAWISMEMSKFAMLIIGLYFARNGDITPERIALYYLLFQMIANQMGQVMRVFPQMSRGMEGIRSIGEILESPDLEFNQGKDRVQHIQGDITFDNVRFSYGDKDHATINNFNLDIKRGEVVAFVGESGAGKSTLMNLCIGFWRVQNGSIKIDGRDINELDMRSVRRHMAVVPQHTILFSGTLRDNICYGLDDVSDEAVWAAIDNANLRSVVADMPDGLDSRIGENGIKLSGGQRQRVAIARAMIRDPKLIILDEATSALDVISEREVQIAIEALVKGRTTLIVAHRLSTIRHADRVVVMKNGDCIEMGTQHELMEQKGEFYELRRLQA